MPELYSSTPAKEKNTTSVSLKKDRTFLPRKGGNSLSSFLVLPSDRVRFETQEPQEKILMLLRQHWLVNVPWFVISLLLLFAPLVLRFFPLLESFPVRFQLVAIIGWYLILLMFVFERFLAWFFNISIITDERIIDIDFLNITTKKIADCDLDKIQDVTYTNSGAIGTIFNFGDVRVQTAAEVVEFIFDEVPRPSKVADVLQQMRAEEKQEALEGRIR